MSNLYPAEFRERALRMLAEARADRAAAIVDVTLASVYDRIGLLPRG